MKAAKEPKARDSQRIFPNGEDPSGKSMAILTDAPNIRGSTIKKENRVASGFSLPNRIDVQMVAPERESPGNNAANPCARPMVPASRKVRGLEEKAALSAK